MMARLALVVLFLLSASWAAVCQEKGGSSGEKTRREGGDTCAENRDKLYVRRNVLEQFAAILNASIPESERLSRSKYSVRHDKAYAFGVYDLTDTSNVDSGGTGGCVELIDNHIYHVVPLLNDDSFSHIIILEGGSLKVFRSINCPGRGDKLDDVIGYLNLKLAGDQNKSEIIARVMDYRRYGRYFMMDPFSRLTCGPAVKSPGAGRQQAAPPE